MQLLIHCPHCETSYKVDEEQLQQSGGQVRCFHCSEVFNGLLNAQPVATGTPAEPEFSEQELAEISSQLENLTRDSSAQPRSSRDLLDDSSSAVDDSLSSVMAEPHSDTISGPDDPHLSASQLAAEEDFDIDRDLPVLKPANPDLLDVRKNLDFQLYGKPAPSAGAIVLVLALTLLAGLQAAWLWRAPLLANPSLHRLASQACLAIGCQLPTRRDIGAFEVLERQVRSHPTADDVLQIRLLYRNNAGFAQPVPGLLLSLFDAEQQLVARRSFGPEQFTRPAPDSWLAPAENGEIELNLRDPGSRVTGFELAFF